MNKHTALFITTFGGIGNYAGGGTIVSYMMLLCFYLSFSIKIALLISLFVLAYLAIPMVCNHYKKDDPRQIVIDEAIGVIVLLMSLQYVGISSLYQILVGITLFRVFDITKIGGLKHIETLSGATGVIFDDVVAALYASFLMYLFL